MLREAPSCKVANFDPNRIGYSYSHTYRPRREWYLPCKSGIEWMVALTLLILTAPLIALMAGLTRLISPGPAFYRQVRLGLRGRPFSMYKIRTMVIDSEIKTGPVWSNPSGEDPRVTSLGRILRDTHLDELPQLWNVLRGEMSLIGPRPERPELVTQIEEALPDYPQRMRVKPGMTGLAQVQRPADADLEDVRHKLAYDLYYVKEVGLLLDLRVVICTVLHMTGLALNCMGKLLVRTHGRNAEYWLETLPPVRRTARNLGVA